MTSIYNKIPVLVVGGREVSLAVIRSFANNKIPVIFVSHEPGDFSSSSRFVDKTHLLPNPNTHEEQFVESLLNLSKEYPEALLLPCSDDALQVCSKHKDKLDTKFVTSFPDWPVLQRILDKKFTYETAEKIGIPCPKTITVSSIEEIQEKGDSIMYPCVIKPSTGHLFVEIFGSKMVFVNNKQELLENFSNLVESGLVLMIQEFIPGPDSQNVNYMSFVDNYKTHVEFTAAKVRNDPPSTGSPRVTVSRKIPEILEPGQRILNALNYSGYSCTEFKFDVRDQKYKLLEVNGRVNRSIYQPIKCGIDFPKMIYDYYLYNILPVQKDYKEGIYWIDDFRDIVRSIQYIKKEKYSFREYVKPYFSPHVFAVLNRKDPLPFFSRIHKMRKYGNIESGAKLKRVGSFLRFQK